MASPSESQPPSDPEDSNELTASNETPSAEAGTPSEVPA